MEGCEEKDLGMELDQFPEVVEHLELQRPVVWVDSEVMLEFDFWVF